MLYEDYQFRKVITLVVGILIAFIGIGGWIWFSIYVLPTLPGNHFILVAGIQSAHATTLNTTANLPVPITVHVDSGEKGAAAPIVDAGSGGLLASIIGIGSATAYRWKQGHKREVVAAQTTAQVANSLKSTDTGIADTLDTIHQAISLIPGIPPEAKELVGTEVEAWKKDNTKYYDNTAPIPEALSGDPVVRAQAKVQQITAATDD